MATNKRITRRNHPLYHLWKAMVRRCHNPKDQGYENYGGRGITVCDRWRRSFEAFVEDVPPRPSLAYTLDRRENDKGYEPDNVRWATRSEQNRNARFNHFLTANNKTQTLEEWQKETGIPKSTLFNRFRRKWTDEDIINTPVQAKVADNSFFPPGGVELCRSLGLNFKSVASRMRRGWTFARAIATPMAPPKGGRRRD